MTTYGLEASKLAVNAELDRALRKHPNPMHSYHEGYAIILEEMDELWDEIKAQKPDPEKIRNEAVQVAAMAIRFMADLGWEEPS